TILLWDPATGERIGEPLEGHTKSIKSVAFSPDGKLLASGSGDTTIILWDVATHERAAPPLRGHSDWVNSVAFSPDGTMLASGADDYAVRLWDVATGLPFGSPLIAHERWVLGVAFNPDDSNGLTLASSSADNSIILWDARSGRRVGPALTGHGDRVNALAFNHAGTQLVSGSDDGRIALWDVGLESWQARACAVANRSLGRSEWAQYFPGQSYRATCSDLPEPGYAIAQVLGLAETLVLANENEAAASLYEQAVAWTVETESSLINNSVCWSGSLDGFAQAVLPACARAVELEPEDGNVRDSRGLARALTGDIPGAIEDFRFYVEWAEDDPSAEQLRRKREGWIVELEAGRNPFDPETLEALRNE
ncbi:MAG TPA: hypothetical protein VER55_16235, partial [Ardenticatenaceae bacterium]|nr:hypothetical protein [Ardenticatenaceae bacterium]